VYTSPDRRNDTTGQRPRLIHNGPCGRRELCWRPECQSTFGPLRTVEVLSTGDAIAYCHRSRFQIRPPVQAAA
jgi:hypothetical protein